jgi:hypothetical protein
MPQGSALFQRGLHRHATDTAIKSWCPCPGASFMVRAFEPRFGGAHFLMGSLSSGAAMARTVRKASAPSAACCRIQNANWRYSLGEVMTVETLALGRADEPDHARRALNLSDSSSALVDKIATAARALRWSEQTVEAKRGQRQSITKMQIQTMDQMMGALEEQIKLPNPKTVSRSALLSKLKVYCRSLSRLAGGQTGRLFK